MQWPLLLVGSRNHLWCSVMSFSGFACCILCWAHLAQFKLQIARESYLVFEGSSRAIPHATAAGRWLVLSCGLSVYLSLSCLQLQSLCLRALQ